MTATKSQVNSLQAILDRQKQAPLEESEEAKTEEKLLRQERTQTKPSRKNTTLIGGYFPPSVARQLGILAAE